MIWNPLNHPLIQDGYLISPDGCIRYKDIDESMSYTAEYHSSNGYDYAIFINKDNKPQLFPIDEIVSMVYIPIPDNLKDKQLTIKHINGNNRDISLENMIWVEDIEIWKDITYPGVKPGVYEVSNHGRIRNKTRCTLVKIRILLNYCYVALMSSYSDGSKNFRLHRLVAWEFVDGKNINLEVNHIDLSKRNQYYKNLEWIDRKHNEVHYYMHIKRKIKEPKPHVRLVDADVQDAVRDELLDPANNGSTRIVYEKLKNRFPFITHSIVVNIKHNYSKSYRLSNRYDVSTLVFQKAKRVFQNRFPDEGIDDVIEELLKPENGGSPTRVYNKLKNKYPNVSIDIIKDIKRKRPYYLNRNTKYNLEEINFPKYR